MLISLSYIFLVGMFLSWICKKMGLPGLLGMIFTGILLGNGRLDEVQSVAAGTEDETAGELVSAEDHPLRR